uniref:hypothetical protein n=1 Tax=Methylobacterium sp. B34 TaxID=95563 RepID=UPI000FE13C38|nr:hypothetical protein [Methylobacterium sp. B34]
MELASVVVVPRTRSVPVTPRPPFSVPLPGVRRLSPPVKSMALVRVVVLPLKPPEIVPLLVTPMFAPDMPAPP